MAIVSILAAGIALRTSLIASEAARLDSVALQESVERQRREQFAALVIDQDSRLFATYSQIYAGLQEERLALQTETDADARASISLKIQADGELLQAARPMFQVASPSFAGDELQFDGPARLATWLATDVRLQELRAEVTADRADELHEVTLRLVGFVSILVATLLLLTIAQVTIRRFAVVAAGAGFVLTIGVMVAVGLSDELVPVRIAAIVLAALSVPAAFVLELAVARGASENESQTSADPDGAAAIDHFSAAAETVSRSRSLVERLSPSETGLSDPAELSTSTGRRTALLIASATLLAALSGWLQATAFHEADLAAGRARDHVIAATALTHARIGEAEAAIDQLNRYVQTRVNASNATHEADFYDAGHRDAEAAASRREAQRWATLAAADDKSGILLSSLQGPRGYGPDAGGDSRFPNRLLMEGQRDAIVEVGLGDADNRASAAWSAQGSAYTGLLAVLAVVLYLLGLSLILQSPRIRKVFRNLATVGMLGVGAMLLLQLAGRPGPSELSAERDLEAAQHFANGTVALSVAAADRSEDAMLATARTELEAATTIRTDFGPARQDLSAVYILSGSPEVANYPSIIDVEACRAADRELEELKRLQIDSALAEWNLAYCHYREGLLTDDRARREQAASELSKAIERLPSQGILYANLGVTRLSLGDLEGARRAYGDGVAPTRFQADGTTPIEPFERESVVAAALTELETIGQMLPETRTEAAKLKQFVVSETMPRRSPSQIGISDLELRAVGATLTWQARLSGDGAETAPLSVQYYRLDPGRGEWYVIPPISGDAAPRRVGAGSDLSWGEASLLWMRPPSCPVGRYRVEVYTGSAVASAEVEVVDRALVPEADRLLHVGFCRPADWTVKSAVTGDHEVLESSDGSRGFVVLRGHLPSMSQSLLHLNVQALTLVRSELFPDHLTPAPQPGDAFNGDWHRNQFRSGLAGMEGYMSADGGKTLVNVAAVIDAFGSVTLVAVYGPADDFQTVGQGGLAVLDSVIVFP